MLSTDPISSRSGPGPEAAVQAKEQPNEKISLGIMRLISWGGLFALIGLAGSYYAWIKFLNEPVCRFLLGADATGAVPQQGWLGCLLIGPHSVMRIPLILVISLMAGLGVWLADFARKRRGSFILAALFPYVFFGIISLVERLFPIGDSLPINDSTIEVALIATALAGLPATLGYYFRRVVIGPEPEQITNLSTPGVAGPTAPPEMTAADERTTRI